MAVRLDPEHNERAALTRIGVDFEAARVLEVGCGDGRLTKTFAAHARSVVALEPDREAAADFRAASWPVHVEFHNTGFDRYDPGRRRFDVILFSWSL